MTLIHNPVEKQWTNFSWFSSIIARYSLLNFAQDNQIFLPYQYSVFLQLYVP